MPTSETTYICHYSRTRLFSDVTIVAHYGASASTRVCAEMILTGPRRPEGRSGESALYRETLAQVTR